MSAPPSRKQFTFVSGEISPRLIGRADLPFHRAALRTCRNFVITTEGAAHNRPGSRFLREVRDSTKRVRLVRFVVADAQAYMLEFGENYIRVHTSAGTVLAGSGAHTGGTHSTVMTDSGATFAVDALIGMVIYNLTDGSSGVITDNDGTTVTVSALTGGTDNEWKLDDEYEIPYEIATTYAENDLMRLRWAQQNNVMWIVHPTYPPYELKRVADDEWRFTAYSISLNRPQPPTGVQLESSGPFAFEAASAGYAAQKWDWVVVTVDAQGRRSLPSDPLQRTDATVYPGTKHAEIEWTAPTAGPTPAYYEVFRGTEGIYGYVGRTDAASTIFVDPGLDPDYLDPPPAGRDPFDNTDVPLGDIMDILFSGDTASKTTSPEAQSDYYDYHYTVTLATGESITLKFEARPDAFDGAHTGGTHSTVMTDSGATFTVDALIGMTIYNVTDGSSGVITDNDATTVTVSELTGGVDNQWELDDAYEIWMLLGTRTHTYTPPSGGGGSGGFEPPEY